MTLPEGEVRIETEDDVQYTLTPNRQFVYDRVARSGETETIDESDTPVGWLNGQLVCELLTLPEMFKAIERCYEVEIEIDPSLELTDFRYTTELSSEIMCGVVIESLKILTDKFDYIMIDENRDKDH